MEHSEIPKKRRRAKKPAPDSGNPAASDCAVPPAAPAADEPSEPLRQAPPPPMAPGLVQLDPGLEIKDVEGVHKRLLAALQPGLVLNIDMSRVTTVDTAGVQLLLALRGEAESRGVVIEVIGESAAFNQALAVLGLAGTKLATSRA
jgi:anti-anti-sigma regulatory factor